MLWTVYFMWIVTMNCNCSFYLLIWRLAKSKNERGQPVDDCYEPLLKAAQAGDRTSWNESKRACLTKNERPIHIHGSSLSLSNGVGPEVSFSYLAASMPLMWNGSDDQYL